MASDTATLVLDGRPTIDHFARGVSDMRDLLVTLSSEKANGVSIQWVIDMLDASSAITTVRGISEDMGAVAAVTNAFLDVGKQIQQGGPLPSYVAKPASDLLSLLNGEVTAIRFETADDDVTILTPYDVTAIGSGTATIQPAHGAVEGRVQTITNRGSLRFALYDLLYDKAVSCYLSQGQEHIMADTWGHIAVVEGLVKRDRLSGRPLTIRNVTNIEVRPERGEGRWRAARGALVDFGNEPAEVTIRRIRDAW